MNEIRLRSPATCVLTLMAAYMLKSAKKKDDKYLIHTALGDANGAAHKTVEKRISREPIHHRE